MSVKGQRHQPRVWRSALGYILALMLAVALIGACVLTLAGALLTSRALHERVALDDRVIDMQEARVDEEIQALAAEHRFAPETVLDLVSRDYIKAYGREAVAWWMGLLTEHPVPEAPFPDTVALEEAVRADELFRESTEDFMRRGIARDSVAYPVGKTLQEAVLPIRVSVVALMQPEVAERTDIPALVALLGRARSLLCGAALAMLALLMLTQGKNRGLFAGAALLAADMLLAAMTVAVAWADLPGAMAAISAMLSLQLGVLQQVLLPYVLLTEGALLALGVGMFILYRAEARRARSCQEGKSA